MVERHVANVKVVGSSPTARSSLIGRFKLKAWILWNEAKNEGVVFTGEEGRVDAICARNRHFGVIRSMLGEFFATECYEDEDLVLEEVEL